MKIERDRVVGVSGVRGSRICSRWSARTDDGATINYETFFRDFISKVQSGSGAVKINGNLLLEFVPSNDVRNEQLISADTSFCFHRLEEQEANQNDNNNLKNKDSAFESYRYQKNIPPLALSVLEEFMPAI